MRALRKARGSQLLASASVMRSTAPPSRKAGHVGSLLGHAARITARRTLSWSSGAAQRLGGTSRFAPSLRRSTASKGRFLIPLVVPEPPGLNHLCTSTRRGRAPPPRGSGTALRSRSQGQAPSAPRAGSPCGPCACGAGAAPRPPCRRGSGNLRRLRPRRGGGWLVLGSGGVGGDEVSGVGVDILEVGVVVVVVVGVVRRHLLDAGGDAPHRLHVRLRGRPPPRPPPFAPPPPPCGSRAPSCLSPGAQVALALALGSLPGPRAFVSLPTPSVPPTVTCALARTASASILPVPVPMPLAAATFADRAPLHPMRSVAARLGALLAPLRVLLVPLPFSCSVSRVVLSAARALSPAAAAGLGALSTPSPSLLAACAQACPLRLPLGTPPVASRPPLRAPVAGSLPRLRVVPPPPRITRRASCCLRSCGSVTPGGVRSGAGGRTGRGRPVGKAAFGGYGLRGLVWVWLGLVWARYFAPSLPSAAAAAAPGEAPRARAMATPQRWRRAGGHGRGRGVACWGCGLSSLCA